MLNLARDDIALKNNFFLHVIAHMFLLFFLSIAHALYLLFIAIEQQHALMSTSEG